MPFQSSQSAADVLATSPVPVLDKASLTAALPGLRRASQSLLFVDEGVADYQQLVAGATPGTEVHVLNLVQDAATQITQALLGREGITSLQIVSHGESGGLDFGSSRLNSVNLLEVADRLQTWRQALTVDADILLYGCNVAAGEQGRTFVHQLAQLTGADVAASVNLTGDAEQGGDWTLEFQTGTIEAASAFAPRVLRSYHGTLAPFTPGNLVVVRVGDGSSALGANATATFLDEYTTAGSLVQSIALPTAASGSNAQFTLSGNAVSEGGLSRSTDGQFLALAGYDTSVGSATNGTTATSVNRIVARVGTDGTIDTSTRISNGYSTGNIRSAATIDGTGFWTSGTGTGGGTRYVSFGGSGSSTQISATTANTRVVNLFDGQLYTSTGSGALRLATVGTGTPTTLGQTTTNLPGFSTTGSPYGFFFADLDGTAGVDTVYVADDLASRIQKYSLASGNWTASGTITAANVTGLTGSVSGSTVTLFASSATSLLSFTDVTGYNAAASGTATSLTSAATNTVFRGVAFAPAIATPSVSLATITPNLTEGSSGSFTIARGSSTVGDLVVNLTIDGTSTATSGDYTLSGASVSVSGSNVTVVIPNGQNSVTLNMVALAEAIGFAEAADTLKLNLATGTGYSVGISNTATVTIAQNDFVVINTNDSGEGSLRQAILNANAIAGIDDVTFSLGAGAQTINLATALPDLSDSVNILNSTGANNLTIQANTPGAFNIFTVSRRQTASFAQLTLRAGNVGIEYSGTISSITNSIISGNREYGIFGDRDDPDSNIGSISNSTFSGNGLSGLFTNGTIGSISNSTFSGNGLSGLLAGPTGSNETIGSISNSTFSGNTQDGLSIGGTVGSISNSTFSGNTENGISSGSDITDLRNNTIAGNGRQGVFTTTTIANLFNNLIVENGNNTVSGSITNQSNNLTGTFAALNVSPTLANNGGSTLTHALLPGSAAINAGTLTSAPSTDQRGVGRSDGAIDIGAFESRGFAIVPATGTPQSAIRNTAFGNPLVVTVTSAFGEPVNGGRVTFSAPTTGASTTVTSQTGTIASGQASVTETANNTIGTYTVTASISGIATPANFSLTNTNTRPVVTTLSKGGTEDTPVSFSSADFTAQFTDGNGDSLTKIQITALPTKGTLQLGGVNVTLNQEITAAQLAALTYVPNPNSNGLDSFSWNGSDGIDYATSGATVTLNITPVNDRPSVTPTANPVVTAGAGTQTIANLASFNPGAPNEAGQTATYTIVSNSNLGLFAGQPTIAPDGTLVYTPIASLTSPQTATLTIQVQDNGGTANGGIDTSTTQTFTITVNPAPTPPIVLPPIVPPPIVVLPLVTPPPNLAASPIFTLFQLKQTFTLNKATQKLLAAQPPGLQQLFDEEYYLNKNADIAAAVARGVFQSGFQHFLTYGQYEGRNPSALYNEQYYLNQNADIAAAVARGSFRCGFQHFVQYGEYEGRNPSTVFNEQSYLAQNVNVAAAVARGVFRSGLQHFLQFGFVEGRLPQLTLFNESYYLSQNPDVAAAVARGLFKNGLQHFEQYGQWEGRQPSILFNERYYLSQNPDVAVAVAQGGFKSGFEHYLDFGRFEGRSGIG